MEKHPKDEDESKVQDSDSVTLSKDEHQKLLDQANELESMRERTLRTAADYDNAKKRLGKEREEFIRFSQEKLLKDLLPVLDNFERALAHSESVDKNVALGVQMIWKQLLDALTAQGLKRQSSLGLPFDPHLHDAIDEVEEEGPEGVIVSEVLSGYLLHDRVLRPAKVRVRVRPRDKSFQTEEKEEELT